MSNDVGSLLSADRIHGRLGDVEEFGQRVCVAAEERAFFRAFGDVERDNGFEGFADIFLARRVSSSFDDLGCGSR